MQMGVSSLVLEGENMLWFFLFSTYKNIKFYFLYWRDSRDFGAIYNPKKTQDDTKRQRLSVNFRSVGVSPKGLFTGS